MAPMVLAVCFLFWDYWRSFDGPYSPTFFDLLSISYAGVFAIGLPLYLLFELFRIRAAWAYSLVGLTIGLSLSAFSEFFLPADPSGDLPPGYEPPTQWDLIIWFGVFGLIVTTAFWVVRYGIYRNRASH